MRYALLGTRIPARGRRKDGHAHDPLSLDVLAPSILPARTLRDSVPPASLLALLVERSSVAMVAIGDGSPIVLSLNPERSLLRDTSPHPSPGLL